MTFYLLSYPFFKTALLICTENTFWDVGGDGNFVQSFKKSFTFFVEHGTWEMVKINIDIFGNEQGEIGRASCRERVCLAV